MRYLLPLLLLTLLLTAPLAAGDREGVPGNLARLDSCARVIADSLLPAVAEGDTLLLPPLLGEVAPMVIEHLLAAARVRGLAVTSGRCHEAEPGIVSTQVLYSSAGGSALLRESRVTVEIAPRARCAAPLAESRILVAVLRDTVGVQDTALLADPRVAASQGRFTEEESEGWLAPLLVIGSVLLSTLLLFTVRSGQ